MVSVNEDREFTRLRDECRARGILVAFGTAQDSPRVLHPEEEEYLRRAGSTAARGDFLASRACAEVALAHLTLTRPPMLPRAFSAPDWPPGVLGSLSHTPGAALAGVATGPTCTALGVDIQAITTLAPGARRFFLTLREQDRLRMLRREAESVPWEMVLFSAKESVYKALPGDDSRPPRLTDIDIAPNLDGTFRARVRRQPLAGAVAFWAASASHVATVAALQR